MNKTRYWLLFALGLIVAIGVAFFQDAPGYMDADYYFYGAVRLADGQGFTEMVLWNYLDDPAGLPHISHIYWMPLTSLVAALGLKLFGFIGGFRAAQVFFVLTAASIPPLTAALSHSLTGQKDQAVLAGVLAAFSGFYLAFVTTTDAFGLFMLLGGCFYLIGIRKGKRRFLALGLIAGLMHLGRADGLLWLAGAGFLLLVEERRWQDILRGGGEVLLGYLLVMLPWYARNLGVFGSLFPAGSGQALWLLEYDQLFSYPASQLTFSRWAEVNLGEHLRWRWWALGQNLITGLAVQGMILLGPLALLGAWRLRKQRVIQAGGVVWVLLLSMMTLAFPFAGVRGGFFHSSAAFVPVVAALVPVGLADLIQWTVRVFNWETRKIRPFLIGLMLIFVVSFSAFRALGQVIGVEPEAIPQWSLQARRYRQLDAEMVKLGALPQDVVMVVNPPGFANASSRPAIALPYNGLDAALAAAQRYQARYILLEADHPASLNDLYADPTDREFLHYLGTVEGTHIFSVEEIGP